MPSTPQQRAIAIAAAVLAATITALLTGCADATGPTAQRHSPQIAAAIGSGVLSVAITEGPSEMTVGATAAYAAAATQIRGNRPVPPKEVKWVSTDSDVVRMTGNVATAVAAGTTTIRVIFNGGSAERNVTVSDAPPAPTHLLMLYQLNTEALERPALINSDGSNEQLLNLDLGYHHFDLSPDRSRLAFAKAFDNRIFTSAADGTGIQVLVSSNVNYVPRWSADGQKIVWVREVTIGAPSREIFTMDASGANQMQLTFNGSEDNAPMFSPDRAKIVFQSNRSGNYDIWVMNVDGTNQMPLAASPATDGGPSWSPDGSRIAFLSDRSGTTQVFTMAADGTDVRQLTTLTGIRSDVTLIWAPDGSRIAFGRTLAAQGSAWFITPDGSQLTQFRTPDSSRSWEFITSWRN